MRGAPTPVHVCHFWTSISTFAFVSITKRERERERQRDRETERQRDRETERDRTEYEVKILVFQAPDYLDVDVQEPSGQN